MAWRRWVLGGVLVGIVACAQAQRSEGISSTVTLAELRNRLRPLLIFAPTANDARLLEQMRVVSTHSAEAAERNLLAVAVPERGSFPTGYRLAEGDLAEARKRFGVKAGEFVVVLVGKDGGEKLRNGMPLSFEKLRETIDAMPMRQAEMRAGRR